MDLLGIPSIAALRWSHKDWVEEALARAAQVREGKWTESIAAGSRNFVEIIRGEPRMTAMRRRIPRTDEESGLSEPQVS